MKPAAFKTEADLCRAFIEQAGAEGWTAYPETAGFDALLVNAAGEQIGVQAKLRFNLKVLWQITDVPEHDKTCDPDYRAVLVPSMDYASRRLCGLLGVALLVPDKDRPVADAVAGLGWNPYRRHTLPEFLPDVRAGASAPVQLTHWKIDALKVIAAAEVRGFVTRADFKRVGIDSRRWVNPASGWLKAGANPGEFIIGPRCGFHLQHPDVYPKVLAKVREEFAADAVLAKGA